MNFEMIIPLAGEKKQHFGEWNVVVMKLKAFCRSSFVYSESDIVRFGALAPTGFLIVVVFTLYKQNEILPNFELWFRLQQTMKLYMPANQFKNSQNQCLTLFISNGFS